jgi:hypothetical protein
MESINVDDLIKSLEFVGEEMRNDELVNQWMEILQNNMKKYQIGQYEGYI